ncbi:PA2169 family four-helix-bundle protein [Parvularcula marina]|uniref:PA2169 family four-helix-bundle protein n=1 Tax=Parvularcula marina TaxID=2292771 RepID=A0A371RJP6_9PROT|nr:PA2169 family four-helix-bundle protein [Parvularcula marina]RFB05671.1 PA2169 family four-helix-bundle protein [Parvularcula marina]
MTKDVDVLKDVTKMLIDSQKGYAKAAEVTDDNYVLHAEFMERSQERAQLITDFQTQTQSLGAEPETDGGVLGTLHRAMTDFSSLFRDDEKAALGAIDDGEERLAEYIESKLDDDITPPTRGLLQKAHMSARAGEAYAERMEHRV